MAQHFLLSAAARTLSLAEIMRLDEAEAIALFQVVRWPDTGGAPVCPHCRCPACYACPRPGGAPRFRCKACRRDFSLTSGTLFAYHKLGIRDYLAAAAIFCNEVKGKPALALSRDLGVQYKTAFVLAHKLREAMAREVSALALAPAARGTPLGGPGRAVEIDGAYFGGHARPKNRKAERADRRRAENRTGKRRVVVVIRERLLAGTMLDGAAPGRTLPAVFASEDAAQGFIRACVDPASIVHADESAAWNVLHARFDTKRINHSVEYANDEACTNQAESFFSRLRRAEIGHHHHLAGAYLVRYAREMAWREGHRVASTGAQFRTVIRLVAANRPSVDFCGYWQRSRPAA